MILKISFYFGDGRKSFNEYPLLSALTNANSQLFWVGQYLSCLHYTLVSKQISCKLDSKLKRNYRFDFPHGLVRWFYQRRTSSVSIPARVWVTRDNEYGISDIHRSLSLQWYRDSSKNVDRSNFLASSTFIETWREPIGKYKNVKI